MPRAARSAGSSAPGQQRRRDEVDVELAAPGVGVELGDRPEVDDARRRGRRESSALRQPRRRRRPTPGRRGRRPAASASGEVGRSSSARSGGARRQHQPVAALVQRRRPASAPMPDPAPVTTVRPASAGEDDLAEDVAVGHRGEPVAGLLHRQRPVDQRPGAGGVEHRRPATASSSRVPMVEPITRSWRKKIRVSSASSSVRARRWCRR